MKKSMRFDGIPEFRPNKVALMEAILFLIDQAAGIGRRLSKGEIVKCLFLADDAHLTEYGRPITFDNYIAMKKGPVGNLSSDMLNGKVDWDDFGVPQSPWSTMEQNGLTFYTAPRQNIVPIELSRSDLTQLAAAFAKVTTSGFETVSEISHAHPAWIAAWGPGENKAVAMDWRRFPALDESRALDLVSASWAGQ